MNFTPIIPVIFSDLQAWEREGLEPLFECLENYFNVKRREVPRGRKIAPLAQGSFWIFANDWRAAIRRIQPAPRIKIYVSVLDNLTAPGWLPALFLKSVKPSSNSCIHLVAHSQLSYRFLREMQQVPENQISLIPLPFSNILLEKKTNPNSNKTVGIASRLTPESNLHYFLTLAHYIHAKEPQIHFNIVGQGPLKEHLEKIVSELRLREVVEIFDSNDRRVTDFDCLIFPSLQPMHFLPLLLAAGAGIPCLVNEMSGIETFIEEGKDGFITPLNEIKTMAELVIRLAQDSIFSTAIAEKYREKIAQKFDSAIWIKDFENLILGNKLVVGLMPNQKAA